MSGKVFSGSAAISDIVIKEESEEPDNIEISLSINDIIRQQSKCAQMIWSVEEIIFFALTDNTPFPRRSDLHGDTFGCRENKIR